MSYMKLSLPAEVGIICYDIINKKAEEILPVQHLQCTCTHGTCEEFEDRNRFTHWHSYQPLEGGKQKVVKVEKK